MLQHQFYNMSVVNKLMQLTYHLSIVGGRQRLQYYCVPYLQKVMLFFHHVSGCQADCGTRPACRHQAVGTHWHQILAHLYLSGANQCLLNECTPPDLALLLMLRDPMLTLCRQFLDITSYITFVPIVRLPSTYCSA